ncbi:hypothetical protein GCM10007414_16150 [Agarivorans gilvus]|uniref:Uncharacterized protein n=1 Tax=Agarivorans gilvus TaxID=680279 RepID=A0ABQ1I1X9_9ALTE|nr:hypothetical protein GCM10007414_16150 [Agarivorans gilvus]
MSSLLSLNIINKKVNYIHLGFSIKIGERPRMARLKYSQRCKLLAGVIIHKQVNNALTLLINCATFGLINP